MKSDFLIVVPSPELRQEQFWDSSDDVLVSRNARVFFREAVNRTFSPPLSAIAVATKLQQLERSVEILDVALEFGIPFTSQGVELRYEQVAAYLRQNSPRFGVLVSCLSARDDISIRRTAAEAKKQEPGCPVVLGGYHASACAYDLIKDPNIDMVLAGDFEPVAEQLVDVLLRPDPTKVKAIPNLLTKEVFESIGQFHRTRFAPAETLSLFDFSTVTKYLPKYDMLGMVASKGCPFPCSFCQEHVARTTYGALPPSHAATIASDILACFENVTGNGAVGFYFMDALFGVQRGWIKSLARELVDLASPLRWTFQSRVDSLGDCDFDLLRKSGCYLINLGLESFSPLMLKRMQKTQNPTKYLLAFGEILERTRDADIGVEFNILFGAPGETRETLLETERAIYATLDEFPGTTVNLNLFRLFPETQSFYEAGKLYGSRVLIPDWWRRGVIPEITVTVQPSSDLMPVDLLAFQERIYQTDVAYRRRGSPGEADNWVRRGGVPPSALRVVAERNRMAFLSKVSAPSST